MGMVPRLQGHWIYGLGAGDVGLYGGTDIVGFVNVGASTRLYLSPWTNLSLQADATINGIALIELDAFGWLTGVARWTTSATPKRWLYGGVQLGAFAPYDGTDVDEPWIMPGAVIGIQVPSASLGAIGYGVDALQIELVITPFFFEGLDTFPDNRRDQISDTLFLDRMPAWMASQISIGGHRDRDRRQTRIEPSDPDIGAPAQPSSEQPERREEGDDDRDEQPDESEAPPEPDYDEDGVPVY